MEQKSIYYRYFVYSAEEEDLRKRVHGENVSFGTVIVNGVAKRYTSIVTDPINTKSDALIICKGDIRKIKYTPPTR